MLLPAAAAWATAWLVVAAPDAGLDPVALAWMLWGAGGVVVVVTATLTRTTTPCPPRPGDRRTSTIGRHIGRLGPAVIVMLACAGLVTTAAAVGLAMRAESPLTDAASAHRIVNVVIDVAAAPRELRGSTWAAASDDPMLRVDARVVAVNGRDTAPVAATSTLSVPRQSAQFGARLAFDARVDVLPAQEESGFRLRQVGAAVQGVPPPPWLAWTVGLREGFAAAARGLGGDGAALVPGLATGDTSAVGEELDAAMKASSLSHLTAVSGANCAIVTAAAFALAALCGFRRSGRVMVAAFALIGFVLLVTPQPSVVRAGAMAIVVLIAIASGRPGGGVAALSVAIVALLAFDPWLARDYGFALSASATAGLLLLAAPLMARLARIMPMPLAMVLAVPLAAQLACQPILVLLDPAIALFGVPANLLAAPAAPIGTVVGLVGCLVLPFLPSVGVALLQVAWLPASWIALVAHGAAELPGGRLPWVPDAAGALLLVACTVLALWLALAGGARPGLRALAAGLLAVAVAVPVGISIGGPLIGTATRPTSWDVTACDIGQGDAVLVRSGDATALIDTGPDPAALERCLALLGIGRIDLLVVTHWDADHAGGASAVVGRVATVIHGPLDGERSDRVLGPLTRAGADAIEVVAGHRGALGEARWRVLWPRPRAAPGNDASVVIDLDAPGYRAVFLGDLGEESQASMLRSVDVGRADLVKVAHHGSADQSEPLYRELGATVGVIGVGAENGYGHPTDRLLALLAGAGTSAVRTDQSGTVVLTAEPDGGFRVWSERGGGS